MAGSRLSAVLAVLCIGASMSLSAQFTIDFGPGVNVSNTPDSTARTDYRIVVDPGTQEKVHVVTYAEGPNGQRDIFVRHSTDDARTWSPPVNLSNTAAQSNVLDEPGNSRRPAIAASDGGVLISWVDTYCPGGNQGTYTDDEDELTAFGCIHVARSNDAGRTWSTGEQLTDGSRDAINPYPAASSSGFALAWQEDPEGVPGTGQEGASGASGSPGTNIHYSALSGADFASATPFPADTVVSDNTGTSGGDPAATRPNLQLTGGTALLGYEEKKDGARGKNVILHTFGLLTPPSGAAGDVMNDPAENARRVRITAQPAAAAGPSDTRALFIWRQGVGVQGAPADFMMRRAVGGHDFARFQPAINLSGATLASPTDANPDDSIRGHRAILNGDRAAVVYIYTPSETLRALQEANYNATTRSSRDGGATWSAPRNVSGVTDNTITAFAPRIIATPPAIPSGDPLDTRDPDAYFVGWDTRTNTVEPHESERIDAWTAVTGTFGADFSDPLPVANDPAAGEYSVVLQTFPSGRVLCAVWRQRDAETRPDAWIRCGPRNLVPRIVSVGSWPALLALALLMLGAARRFRTSA
jgi:hypothetical protein